MVVVVVDMDWWVLVSAGPAEVDGWFPLRSFFNLFEYIQGIDNDRIV